MTSSEECVAPSRAGHRARFPSELRGHGILVFSAFAVAFSSSLVTPLLPAILNHFGLALEVQARHVALLTGAYLLAMFVAAPVLGYLSDRIDRRVILLSAMGVYALSLYGLSSTSSLGGLYAIRVIAGLGAGGILPVIQAYVADYSAREQRVHRFAWIVTATLTGSLAGPYLGGLATGSEAWPRSGAAPSLHLITEQVLAAAILCSASLISIALIFRKRVLSQAEVRAELGIGAAGLPPAMYGLFSLSLVVMFAVGAFDAGMSTIARSTLQLSASQLAMLYAECALVMLVIQTLYFAEWFKSFAHQHLMFPAMLIAAAALGFFPLVRTSGQLVGVVALMAAGAGAIAPLISYRVSILADARQGTSFGLQSAFSYLGQGLGAISSGVLFALDSKLPYWLAAVMLIAGAVRIVLRMRPLSR